MTYVTMNCSAVDPCGLRSEVGFPPSMPPRLDSFWLHGSPISKKPGVVADARPGGPSAKRQPSPEGLGISPEDDLSAVGAALNLGPPHRSVVPIERVGGKAKKTIR